MKAKIKLPVIETPAPVTAAKPKSLRPMRSMVAVRSLKSRTGVAQVALKREANVEAPR